MARRLVRQPTGPLLVSGAVTASPNLVLFKPVADVLRQVVDSAVCLDVGRPLLPIALLRCRLWRDAHEFGVRLGGPRLRTTIQAILQSLVIQYWVARAECTSRLLVSSRTISCNVP